MNEREATDLVHRLAGDVKEVPAPIDRLVAGGRAMRRRRRLRHAAGGAALVGVVLSGGAIAAVSGDGEGQDAAYNRREQPVTTPPTAALGTRLVGLGRVVVEVPQEWVVAENGCAQDVGVVHRYPDTFESVGQSVCTPFPRNQPFASLAVGDGASPAGARVMEASAWARETDVDGLSVMWASHTQEVPEFCGSVGTPGQMCELLFWTPAEDMFFHLVARGPDARETVVAVRDSIQVLPEGWTTVPFIKQWTEDAEAAQTLEDAGLVAGLPGVDWPHSVAATAPEGGSVVELGSTVRLVPGDG